jgi:predicted TIM-barrel fold metal-dependent hydrolase
MIIDANAYLGHFAFRKLTCTTAADLVRLMDEKGIDRALVSSAAAITYRNTQSANEDLAAEVKLLGDRLVPLAVINPSYAGWEDDLRICRDELGMRGLRLYPKWHNYALSDSCCRELINAASQSGLFVSLPVRVEDYRQRSWLVDVPDLPLEEIVNLVKSHPQARFLIVNGAGFSGSPLGKADNGLPANYLLEISRLRALMENEIGQLLASLGPERVVFGSGMPFTAAEPALLKLEVLAADDGVKDKIRWQNVVSFLNL